MGLQVQVWESVIQISRMHVNGVLWNTEPVGHQELQTLVFTQIMTFKVCHMV